jgi:hypothetical protein
MRQASFAQHAVAFSHAKMIHPKTIHPKSDA